MNKHFFNGLACAIALLLPNVGTINAQQANAAAPQSLISNGDFATPLANGWVVNGKTVTEPKIVNAKIEGAPFTRALQLELAAPKGAQTWDARLAATKTPLAIAKDDVIAVEFWARSTSKTQVLVIFQQAAKPYEKSIRQVATLGMEWKKYTFYAPAKSDLKSGGSNFEIQLGQATGTVELAGLNVQNTGPIGTTATETNTKAAQTSVPQSLIANGDFAEPLANSWTVEGKTVSEPKIADAKIEGAPFTRALQLELTSSAGAQPWDARLVAAKTLLAIAKNDMILVQFWARSTPTTRFLVVYQQSGTPYGKSVRQTATLRSQWQKYTFYAPAQSDYKAGGSNFEIQLGHATGKVELAGLSVQNIGPLSVDATKERYGAETFDYYGGTDPDDSWIPAAQARIEKFRKADLEIRVVDKKGQPIRDAQVVVKQTKAAFRWGTAVNEKLLAQTPDGEIYRATLKRLFNSAVLENHLKWNATDGKPQVQKTAIEMLDWLNANGFAVRGHTLVWGSERYLPARLKTSSPDATREAVNQRIVDALTLTKGKVYVWDVVNEAGVNTQLWDKIGWDSFSEVYRLARRTNPELLLAYNDYNISNEAPDNGALRQKVEARIQTLIDAGAPLDILGDQAHMGVPLTPIPRVLQIWDEWGKKYQKSIEITEFDTNVADDTVHGKYVRDYLTAAFSNPNIDSFLVWGFWAKAHFLGERGALFRADWSPRPAALAYEDLVLNKWRTNQTMTTDKDGIVQLRGFLGDYDVEIIKGGKNITSQISLEKTGLQKKVVIP